MEGLLADLKALCFSGFYSSSNLNEKVMSVKEARVRIAQFDQSLCAFFKCVVTLPEAIMTSYAKTESLLGLTIGSLSAGPVSRCVSMYVRKILK